MFVQQCKVQERTSQVDILQKIRELHIITLGERTPSELVEKMNAIPTYQRIGFMENKGFFARDSILKSMRVELTHDPQDQRHRSMLLWGTMGVGKTQLALAYAHERKAEEGLAVILWINSQSEDQLLQPCTEICVDLRLKGVVEGGQHKRNRTLLVKWLREIGTDLFYFYLCLERLTSRTCRR